MKPQSIAAQLISASSDIQQKLVHGCTLPPFPHLNPLEYAWQAYCQYLQNYGNSPKDIVFLGMNPGPFGMVQTGIPFGEVAAVRDWLGINSGVHPPNPLHSPRPVDGFACRRSEVSGRRLWGLFRRYYPNANDFFQRHFVLNYCPLAFFDGQRNLTPEQMHKADTAELFALCDQYLQRMVNIFSAKWVVGIGGFAAKRAWIALADPIASGQIKVGQILHPSPASPLANRGWEELAIADLAALGLSLEPVANQTLSDG